MYCPKCGTENAETNKYCRACRENLGVISQAMKQRLPVMIASRLDQILDSRSERFRRDSVLGVLLGFLCVAGGSFGYKDDKFYGVILLGMSCYYLLFGFWSYLAYRRSLAPDFDWGILSGEAPDTESFDKSGLVTHGSEDIARTTDKMNS